MGECHFRFPLTLLFMNLYFLFYSFLLCDFTESKTYLLETNSNEAENVTGQDMAGVKSIPGCIGNIFGNVNIRCVYTEPHTNCFMVTEKEFMEDRCQFKCAKYNRFGNDGTQCLFFY